MEIHGRFGQIRTTGELAKQTHQELVKEYGDRILPPNHPLVRYTQTLVERLLENSNLGSLRRPEDSIYSAVSNVKEQVPIPRGLGSVRDGSNMKWNLIVVHDPNIVNAMATFGTIVLFTGILPIADNPSRLAAVLGHEIAHATLRHPSESLSFMQVLTAIQVLLVATGFDFGPLSDYALRIALDLPNSRKHELEADKVGMMYAARACYDPEGASELQKRLSALEQRGKGKMGGSFNLLRTHPVGEYRIKQLEQSLPEAHAERAKNDQCTDMGPAFSEFSARAGLGGVPGSVSLQPIW